MSRQPISLLSIRVPQDPRILAVKRLIESQPRLRPRHLAEIAEMSKSHLQRLFKKETGTTLVAYAQEVALQRAQEIWTRPAKAAAKSFIGELGIPDSSNFSRAFKKRFGVTATVWRSQAQRD